MKKETSEEEEAMNQLTISHLNLVCVVWMERIHVDLPKLVVVEFNKELDEGVQLVDLG